VALVLLVSAITTSVVSAVPAPPAHADTSASGGEFSPLPYARLFDTNTGSGTPFGPGETRSYQILGAAGVPSAGVGAVVIDVAATSSTASASSSTGVTVWPSGTARPSSAQLRVNSESVPRSNTVIVAPGSDGKISIYNSVGSTDLNVDVQGYFTAAPGSGASPGGYVPLSMTRVFYTIDGTGTSATPLAGGGGTRTVTVGGVGDIPANATAVFANVHVNSASADGKLKIVPDGADPSSANPILNYAVGEPSDSGATLPLSASGKLTIQNVGSGSVNVAIDVEGYFSPDPGVGSGIEPTTPTKLAPVTIPANGTSTITTGGQAGVPTTRVAGVVLSLTATGGGSGSGQGFLKAYAADGDVPIGAILGWSNVTFDPVSTVAIVEPSFDGRITLSNIGNGSITITPTIEGWFPYAFHALVGVEMGAGTTAPTIGQPVPETQLDALGADMSFIHGIESGSIAQPQYDPAGGVFAVGPDVESDDEATTDYSDDPAFDQDPEAPEGPLITTNSDLAQVHDPEPGGGNEWTILAHWNDKFDQRINYRQGRWDSTKKKGFGDIKIREYHNLNKKVVHASTAHPFYGEGPKDGDPNATRWYYDDVYTLYNCDSDGYCTPVEVSYVKVVVQFAVANAPDGKAVGVLTAFCKQGGVPRCPSWVKQSINI
jgi:hypothetical protein